MDFEKCVPTLKKWTKNNKENRGKILYNKRLILVRTRKINKVFQFYEGRLHLNKNN